METNNHTDLDRIHMSYQSLKSMLNMFSLPFVCRGKEPQVVNAANVTYWDGLGGTRSYRGPECGGVWEIRE
jgi:hypothetical protein